MVSGPGSFTGLRVGLAAIKALGEILAKPIVPVSFLDVVAMAGQAQTKCLAALDAGRHQVYVGEYDGRRIVREQLLTMEEFLNFSKGFPVITPDANVAAHTRERRVRGARISSPTSGRGRTAGLAKNPKRGKLSLPKNWTQTICAVPMRNYFLLPGGTEMHVRQATANDLPQIMELERDSPTAAHWSSAHYEAIFAAAEGSRLLLVIEDQSVAGLLIAQDVAGEWEIQNILVARALQGRGLASQLLRTFLDMVSQSGTKSIFLEVRKSNQAARAFYEKSGFIQTGYRSRYYRDPLEDAVLYKLLV